MTATEAKTVVTSRTTTSQTLAANEFRKKLIITNTAAAVKYIRLADATPSNTDHDIVLGVYQTPDATFVLDNYTGPVKADATTVTYVELG
jgi:predicted transglutaminase-like cysteine proteinase